MHLFCIFTLYQVFCLYSFFGFVVVHPDLGMDSDNVLQKHSFQML